MPSIFPGDRRGEQDETSRVWAEPVQDFVDGLSVGVKGDADKVQLRGRARGDGGDLRSRRRTRPADG